MPPAAVKRDLIMGSMATEFAKLTTANGYRNNLGSNVKIWKTDPFTANGISINDGDEVLLEESSGSPGRFKWELSVEIVIVLMSEAANTAQKLRYALADVMELIGANVTWGGYALYTRIERSSFVIEQAEKKTGEAKMFITVSYYTNSFSPT